MSFLGGENFGGRRPRKGFVAAAVAWILISVVMGFTNLGCAKKKELKNEVKPDPFVEKSVLQNKEFSLVRAIEEADSNNPFFAVPGFHLDFGTVRAEITKEQLRLVAVREADNRDETATVLAAYPILQHFDVIREENDFGEKTNKIIEDEKKAWNQRKYMRVDWANPSVSSAQVANQLWAVGVVNEENVVLKEDPRVEQGHLSFLSESTLSFNSSFQAGKSYRVSLRTHLMPVKKSDFKAQPYSDRDFSRFGYFRTQENFEDPARGPLDTTVKKYANIFNVCEASRAESCAKNRIVYRLSDGFPDEFRDLAKKAVREWNEAFQKALGRKDDVVVLDETKSAAISDPRFNVIAYYEPKLNAGLLGVSQTVNAPNTGETISARTTIYGDGIRASVAEAEDLVDLIVADPDFRKETDRILNPNLVMASAAQQILDGGLLQTAINANPRLKHETRSLSGARLSLVDVAKRAYAASQSTPLQATSLRRKLVERLPGEVGRLKELSVLPVPLGLNIPSTFLRDESKSKTASNMTSLQGFDNLYFFADKVKLEREAQLRMAAANIHTYDFVDDAVARFVERFVRERKDIKSVKQLKAEIGKEVARQTFYSTLLHEMGHNFGLRHNFHASSDSKHFPDTYYELLGKFTSGDKSVKYEDLSSYAQSSVMDYSSDFASEPRGLGPYDLAALRYGYSRSINKSCVGQSCDSTIAGQYKFCTDHQVDDSPLCRRFDRGVNVSEITSYLATRFHKSYVRSHFRRGRANFNDISSSLPFNMLTRYMIPIRQVTDEMVFQLVFGAEDSIEGGPCQKKFMNDSILRGEIVNICDPATAEAAGVDPRDLSTLAAGLFENGQLRVPSPLYASGGLADFVLANEIAKEFFAQILGSGEAGEYLLQENEGQMALEQLPDGEDRTFSEKCGQNELSTSERLRLYGKATQKPNLDQFVRDNLANVVKIPYSPIAKKFGTKVCNEGDGDQVERMGFKWNKILALFALGARDIGISKYQKFSLSGNAYLWPQTESFANMVVRALTEGNATFFNVMVPAGSSAVPVAFPATLDADTQAYAIIVGLTDFISDQDFRFADRMRVCVGSDNRCQGEDTVSFLNATKTSTFSASQTPAKDSVSYELVKGLKAISDQRSQLEGLKKSLPETLATAESLSSEGAQGLIDQLTPVISERAEFEKIRQLLYESSDSALAKVKNLLAERAKMGPFAAQVEITKINEKLEEAAKELAAIVPNKEDVALLAAIEQVKQLQAMLQFGVRAVTIHHFVDGAIISASDQLARDEGTLIFIKRIMSALDLG